MTDQAGVVARAAPWADVAAVRAWPARRRLNVFLIIAATYVAVFLPLYDLAGEGAVNMFALVTAVGGALLGLRAGIFIALVGLLLHALPFGVLVEVDPNLVTPVAATTYALAVLVTGAGFGLMQELRQRMHAQTLAARQQQSWMTALMSNLPVVLFTLDRDGVFTMSEGHGLRAIGREPGEAVGQSIYERWAGREDIFDCVRRALAGETVTGTFDVGAVSYDATYGPLRDAEGAISGVIGVGIDVTERTHAQAELARVAMHDALTGLPNRTLFIDRLEQTLAISRRTFATVGLLLIDLDHFKEVNESVGHALGDELLRQIGTRLGGELRPTDTCARLGGDEFAIVLPEIDAHGATLVARRLADAMRAPFRIGSHELYIRVSTGVAFAPLHGDDPATLLRRAEVAMYGAKRAESGFAVYAPEADEPSPGRLALASDLRHAIERDELRLVFQPIVACATGAPTRFEALLRWTHSQRGEMSPAGFIPLAERAGLIRPLTDWVVGAAVRQVRAWLAQGLDVHVSVNLSARNLADEDLPARVARALREADVPPDRFGFEMTETTLMADPERSSRTIAALRQLGVALAIDDFGTGYSSLSYLHQLPISSVKIDKSFTRSLAINDSGRAIVHATVDLGHALGFTVVAEGVEDASTFDELCRLGCDSAQGYHVARPMPPSAVVAWLRSHAA